MSDPLEFVHPSDYIAALETEIKRLRAENEELKALVLQRVPIHHKLPPDNVGILGCRTKWVVDFGDSGD